MITPTHIFILIILVHYLADFGLQTHAQAIGKGEGKKFINLPLFYHAGIYSLVWTIATIPILDYNLRFLVFGMITFICHYLTDWVTSRISKPLFQKGDFHNGFVVVGFDQVLHYLQLYFTFKLLL